MKTFIKTHDKIKELKDYREIRELSTLCRKFFSEGDGETNFNEIKFITGTEGWKEEEKMSKFSNKNKFHTAKFEFYDYETIEIKDLTFIKI